MNKIDNHHFGDERVNFRSRTEFHPIWGNHYFLNSSSHEIEEPSLHLYGIHRSNA